MLLTVALCSAGLLGAAGGSEEEKLHSSSSLDTVGFGGDAAAVAGWVVGASEAPREAKGSDAAD